MAIKIISKYLTTKQDFHSNKIEENYFDSMLIYSLHHIAFLGNISEENSVEALQKSIKVCFLAGINSNHHFKRIYVFDSTIGTLRIDWRMSKTALNLIIIQTPSLNDKMAIWLWKLANHKNY